MEFIKTLLLYLPFPSGTPEWLIYGLAAGIMAALGLAFMACGPVLYTYGERKIAGFMQDRLGPMRVGPYGTLQAIADTVKLLFKEAVYPAQIDKALFVLAPCLVVTGVFLSFVVLPFSSRLQGADLNIGLLYVIAVGSVPTLGLLMAGWASNNKYSLFSGMRAVAQIVSYEIPTVISLITVVMITGTLSLQETVRAQAGGLGHWFLFAYFPLMPVVFLIFFAASLAECNRTPFDIPEAESELVAGFHTEYGGFLFAMFFMAEYTSMFVVSAVAAVLFLGGWWAPIPALQGLDTLMAVFGVKAPAIGFGPIWLVGKAWSLVVVHMWLRWTLPRLRVDQLMYVAWKVLLPLSLAMALVIGGLTLIPATSRGFGWWDRYAAWVVSVGLFCYLVYGIVAARRWAARRVQGWSVGSAS